MKQRVTIQVNNLIEFNVIVALFGSFGYSASETIARASKERLERSGPVLLHVHHPITSGRQIEWDYVESTNYPDRLNAADLSLSTLIKRLTEEGPIKIEYRDNAMRPVTAEVAFKPDGSLSVGCAEISSAKFEQIAARRKKAMDARSPLD